MLINPLVIQSYADNDLPLASSVAINTEVFNTTYQVKMISNGTRWIPLAPFTVYSAVLNDSVTGTTAATTLREVELPFKYIGPKGSLRWFLASENTTNTNNKFLRVHINDGTTDLKVYDSAISTSGGRTISKMVAVSGSEYNFWCSNNNTSSAESTLSPATYMQLNPTSVLKLKVMAILGNAADIISLTRFHVHIKPGF